MKRKNLCTTLKLLVFACAFTGTISACALAQSHGVSHWATKLMFFTHQSNVWIAVTCLALAILGLRGKRVPDWLYRARYVFVISITLTCLIFCGLLAPFASHVDYSVWQYYSILNHVVVPVLAIADFCLDKQDISLAKKDTWLCFLPPLAYFAFAMPLVLCGVDFGRGEPYPYYFFNFYTEAGLFGFVGDTNPIQIGSVYWFIFIFLIIFGISWLFFVINKSKKINKKETH